MSPLISSMREYESFFQLAERRWVPIVQRTPLRRTDRWAKLLRRISRGRIDLRMRPSLWNWDGNRYIGVVPQSPRAAMLEQAAAGIMAKYANPAYGFSVWEKTYTPINVSVSVTYDDGGILDGLRRMGRELDAIFMSARPDWLAGYTGFMTPKPGDVVLYDPEPGHANENALIQRRFDAT